MAIASLRLAPKYCGDRARGPCLELLRNTSDSSHPTLVSMLPHSVPASTGYTPANGSIWSAILVSCAELLAPVTCLLPRTQGYTPENRYPYGEERVCQHCRLDFQSL